MARGANRRKIQEPVIAIASTSTSGAVGDSDNAAVSDRVIYFFNLASITAGSVTLKIQCSPDDGSTWYDLATTEMNGNTGALTAAGTYHVSATVPFGTRTRLFYTIVTGPIVAAVYPVFEKTGKVF